MALLEVKNLSFKYPTRQEKCLDNISFEIEECDFLTICGTSGSGKSTLLRNLKPALSPFGEKSGEIMFLGKKLNEHDLYSQTKNIGYVLQSPENQIVCDKVWHELAFGLESLKEDPNTIRLRVAEMCSFFGLSNLFYKNTHELSGGQKQLICLASVMAMQPKLLILDEPTSQLDPIASSEFISMLHKINTEIGTSIIICEHRLEEVMPYSTKVLVLENGKIEAFDTPEKISNQLKFKKSKMIYSMPSASQIFTSCENFEISPITVCEGRKYVNSVLTNEKYSIKHEKEKEFSKDILKADSLYFRYEKNSDDVLSNLSIIIKKASHTCILGANGAGKSTLLYNLAGVLKPYRGKIIKDKKIKITMLPQNPQTLFTKETVRAELYENQISQKLEYVISETEVENLLNYHPYDLSGGEMQRVAFAKVLLTSPDILLLDEPTKGMDNFLKKRLAGLIEKFKKLNITIITVSHDVEFCAEYADNCALFFNGSIICENKRREFFSKNSFYTTSANRIIRHKCENAVTTKDVIDLICKEKVLL